MNTGTRVLLAAIGLSCLRAPAQGVDDPHLLDGMLEEPPGVKLISAHSFGPSTNDPHPRYAVEDAAVAPASQQAASLVLEIAGPRTVRLHHWNDWPQNGGYIWFRLDGASLREFRELMPATTDWTIPPGTHHLEILAVNAPVSLFKVVDLVAGRPQLTQPDISLPADGEVSLRLPVQSDSPVTWSAAGLPAGLTLNASTGRITGTATGLEPSSQSVSTWITMTNARGSQTEQLRIWGMNKVNHVSPSASLAGRRARLEGTTEFLYSTDNHYQSATPEEGHVGRDFTYDDREAAPEVVTTVQGPDTLWFRSRGSIEAEQPVVVKIDGVEALRKFARSATDEEMSVSIPAGTHEVTWAFPRGGRMDRVRLDSTPGPRLRGPFTLTARPDAAFSHLISAAGGPAEFYATSLPPGVNLDDITGQLTGQLTGALPAGDHWIPVTAGLNGKMDTALYHLQVRENASPVLGTPNLTWLQTPGYFGWQSHAGAGPDGRTAWEFSSRDATSGSSRMETFIDGPDLLACRFRGLGSGWMEIELDGQRTRQGAASSGWDNYLTVRIPPGRHLLALVAMKSAMDGGVQVDRLQLASAGAPVMTFPAGFYSDGTQVRIPFSIAGGSADSISVTGLPSGLSLEGNIVTGTLGAAESWTSSVFTATRGGQGVSARVEWRRNEINGWLDGTGWYGYFDEGWAPGFHTDVGWDGISALALYQHAWGTRSSGFARLITGPDTLTFRRKSEHAVRLEVKVDGAPVHGELVNSPAWQQVSIAIPAGEHHVTVGGRPPNSGDGTTATEYPTAIPIPALILDDFRLASELRPFFVEPGRRLETLPGQNFSWRPDVSGKIAEWSIPELPAGFSFDEETGTLSATPVTAPPGEYPLVFTAANQHGTDQLGVTLAILAPPAHGDSPRIYLQKDGWFFRTDAPPTKKAPPAITSVDGGDVHVSRFNNLGTMSAWVEGPDTLNFWWRFNNGDTFFFVDMDGETAYRDPDFYPFYWTRQEIAIPPGRHFISWYGYDSVTVDHITLASDGIPQILTEPVQYVDPAGFSLQLTARNAAQSWSAEGFQVNAEGILTGTLDDPVGEQVIRVSATNAAGTGYAALTLRPYTPLNAALDSPIPWSSGPEDPWTAQTPQPGETPQPADGEDFVHDAGDEERLSADIPSGGGLLTIWAMSTGTGGQLTARAEPSHPWYPYFNFDLPDHDWHRIVISLPSQRFIFNISGTPGVDGTLYLDRAEVVRPGDPMIDLVPLPKLTAGQQYAAQVKLLTGGAVQQWQADGLPSGLTINNITGIISGTLAAGTPSTDYPLRITATTPEGKTTFAWMKLSTELDIGSALDTQDLVWRRSSTGATRGWEVSPGSSQWPAHDSVDMMVVNIVPGVSTLETEVDGPGTISFWWDGDEYTLPVFLVDSVRIARPDPAANPGRLRYFAAAIPAGHHTLSWVVENAGSDGNEARLDRVHWSRDGAPRLNGLSFDHEAAPNGSIVWPITVTGAVSSFSSADLPAWLTFHPGSGTLTGTAPAAPDVHSFTLTVEKNGRRDSAVFHLSVRAPLEPVAGGQWHRDPHSTWQSVISDRTGRSTAVFSPDAGDPPLEDLCLAVTAPCIVTFRTRLENPQPTPTISVRADLQPPPAHYARLHPGGLERGAVTVPGTGIAFVYFTGRRSTAGGAVQLNDVQVFPWDADANGDGLSNAMAFALGRWPDAPSAGDPLLLIQPHPSLQDSRLFCFGSAGGDSWLVQLRDHGIRLQLEQATTLETWNPLAGTDEPAGEFARRWRIPAPSAPRAFHRVQALPIVSDLFAPAP